jgi:Spy/CpxP family protein refolding chaperone
MKVRKSISLFVLVLLAVAGTAVLFGQGGPGKFGGPPFAGPGIERGFGFHPGMLRFMAGALDLTEDQQTQIRTLVEQDRATRKEQREAHVAAMEEIQKSIQTATTAKTFDAGALRALYEQRSALLEEGFIRQQQLRHDIFQVLTPEQQEKALEMLAEGPPRHRRH